MYVYNSVDDAYVAARVQRRTGIYVLQARPMWLDRTCQQFIWNKWIWCYVNKTEANLASTNALAARCVRVIHAQCVLQFALLSRTLLRSSSNNEPSDPPYRIIFLFTSVNRVDSIHIQWQTTMICCNGKGLKQVTARNAPWLTRYIMVRHSQHARAPREGTHACTTARS